MSADSRSYIERLLHRNLVLVGALLRRIIKPVGLLVVVFLAGSFGYWVLGHIYGKDWPFLDCAYMTAITLTTVGFSDELGVSAFTAGKIYTMFLIVSGMGATVYGVGALTAFIVEGYLGTLFRESRMESRIEKISGHTIICGAGATGTHVISEHIASGQPFVAIDRDQEKLDAILHHYPKALVLHGDATDEEVLVKAGIERAGGLVCVLSSDKDNVFLVVTGRCMGPNFPIVAKCIEHHSVGKFHAAGASHVVSPTFIGGMRIASQILRPHVVDFLDTMLRSSDSVRVAETTIEEGSELAGKTIVESRLGEKVGLLIVAMKETEHSQFIYSPAGDTVLKPGSVVVVIGPVDKVTVLERMAAA